MGCHTDVARRSLFGLVTVWNMVPEKVVLSGSVHGFQRGLQDALRRRACETDDFDTFFIEALRMPIFVFFLQADYTTSLKQSTRSETEAKERTHTYLNETRASER